MKDIGCRFATVSKKFRKLSTRLYCIETKRINEAVKNNPYKFPESFSWVLIDSEYSNLRSKFSTTNFSNMPRSVPRVFTEQGVAMLATILKPKVAVEVSIQIMDDFVSMRDYIAEHKDVYQSLNHAGEKIFSINKLEDTFIKETLMQYVFHEI